jgi:hypothetical protein
MKFTCQVQINKPKEKVVELFDNPENLKYWQDGYQGFDHISGEPGAVGSKSTIKYKMGKREIELVETILVNNLPDEFAGEYYHKNMTNTMSNRFTAVTDSTTLYESEVHYIALRGFMTKLMAFLFPNMFKKQVQKWMNQFKDFVENQE